jgi:hypothetical protein
MPHAKFNWAARPLPANEGRFQLGETLRLSDTILTKGDGAQGCTLEGTYGMHTKTDKAVLRFFSQM